MHNVAPASLITKIFWDRAQPARVAGPGAWQPGSHVHNHRCAAAGEQPPGSLPHWRGQCIYSFLLLFLLHPSFPTCRLHCNCLLASLSLRCQLYSSHTAASQHLLQPSAPAPTCSPCPLITPVSPPIPPLFLTLPHLPFLPRLMSWVHTPSVFKLLFYKVFFSLMPFFSPFKTSGLTVWT